MKLKLPQCALLVLTELNSVSGVASMFPVSSASLEHPCLLLPSWNQSIGRSRHCRGHFQFYQEREMICNVKANHLNNIYTFLLKSFWQWHSNIIIVFPEIIHHPVFIYSTQHFAGFWLHLQVEPTHAGVGVSR
jgi:hypothetical protein